MNGKAYITERVEFEFSAEYGASNASFKDFLKAVYEILEKVPQKYRDTARISFHSYGEDDYKLSATVFWDREETETERIAREERDAECAQARKRAEDRAELLREEIERNTYERLKRKFDPAPGK